MISNLYRPFRAWYLLNYLSQGDALGFDISPRWGLRELPLRVLADNDFLIIFKKNDCYTLPATAKGDATGLFSLGNDVVDDPGWFYSGDSLV
jgi:hypothetical protein